jgi:alpha-acetolactate decarboxylase
MKQPFVKQGNTELLHFVVIHSDPRKVSHLDSLKGTHIHAIKDALVHKSEEEEKMAAEAPKLPPNTVLAHGTVYDLAGGRFSTGITEKIRRETLGGDIGIASHSTSIQGRMTLNDEAIIVKGTGYLGAYDGSGRKLADDDEFAFVQLVSLENATQINIPSCRNVADMVTQIQNGLGEGTTSFAAYFTGYLPKHAKSRTIRGQDAEGARYNNLKEAWNGWHEFTANKQPVVAHVIGFEGDNERNLKGLVLASPVQAVAIERFKIADKGKYRETNDPLQEHKAAIQIQKVARGYHTRKILQQQRHAQAAVLTCP